MADMVDSGYHTFMAWSRQTVSPNGEIWSNRWLGEFNPDMDAATANELLGHVGMITESGQKMFCRGWDKAQEEFLNLNNIARVCDGY